jgi:HEPN domain-containing protein
MKPITREWIAKAEGDFATAQRENEVQEFPNYDAVCFHSQQCIEKYFKACLQEAAIAFGIRRSSLVPSILIWYS